MMSQLNYKWAVCLVTCSGCNNKENQVMLAYCYGYSTVTSQKSRNAESFIMDLKKQYERKHRAKLNILNIISGKCVLRDLIEDTPMSLLPAMQNYVLHMRRECQERFPCHRLRRKPLTRGGGEYVPGIPGACATRNFAFLARGPYQFSQWLTSNRRQTITGTINEQYPRSQMLILGPNELPAMAPSH